MKNFISNISLRLIIFSLFLANSFLMAQTDWVVNSSEYQYSMTVTAVLSYGNEFSINENDQIGVFDQNGSCVGVSNPSVYYEPLEANLVFMVIYSNSVNNSYSVRAYFEEGGTEVEFLDIIFLANSTQGSIGNPYVFHENETISIEGCTDLDSDNYNPEALYDDGSCFTTVLGCMNQDAPNYDPEANISDDSCISWQDYSQELLDSISAIEITLHTYQNLLATSNASITGLNSDLNTANSSISNLETSLSSTQSDLADTQSDLLFTQSELISTQDALSSTELDLAIANTTITGLNSDLNTANSSISNLETSLSLTQSELSNTASILATTQSDLSDTQSELISTQDALSSTELDLAQANTTISGLNTDLASANSSITNLEDQVAILQNNQEDGISQSDVDAAYADGAASVEIPECEEVSTQNIPIELPEGWSMFGYTCIESVNVVNAFTDISTNIDIVKDEWGLAYLPSWNFSAFDNLEYGEGYQIKMIQEVNNFQFCPKIIVE